MPGASRAYARRLHRKLLLFTLGLLAFLLLMHWAERAGLSRGWIGPIFLFLSVMMYASVGISGRTTDPEEFYVAGRRVPAMYNGMATAADWMSAASFISLAGALYLQGFSGTPAQPGGLAYVLGWTGGFCLVGLLMAPRLRAMRLYTVPDFFAVRFGRGAQLLAALGAVACSFMYVVAQIYGIGLIASRLTGVQFEIGILLGLGGVLLCSFLGGMRAITWTQVVQYVVLLVAFLIPVSWLAYKQLGTPLALLAYGQQLPKIEQLERKLIDSPAEQEVRAHFGERARDYAERLRDPAAALARERSALEDRIRALRAEGADFSFVMMARRELSALPKDEASARELWTRAMNEAQERAKPLGGLPRHGQAFAGNPDGTPAERAEFNTSRLNFLALMFCLMIGTASLPHLLTRFYTTPSVAETRRSVAWSLLFIAMLYLATPALAALVKYEVMQHLVGSSFDALPNWIAQWARVDPGLISVQDVNGDRILQFGEIRLGADMIMLATPELGGLPYVVSGLVAAGGLAAALSTADGLLLTISNALVHDTAPMRGGRVWVSDNRVILSKFALLAVAMVAAATAALKTGEIISLVTASFSLAAATFFPALTLGLFWRGATRRGAVAGMLVGIAVTVGYMLQASAGLRAWWGLAPGGLWWGIHPVSAGFFGVPAGFAVIAAVSAWEHWRRRRMAA
ncbi:MAG TPA: VC_2705 family sodium/solute symporter [Ottowia sp.]|nr:MAG: cation acetate symporter [Burkholderiales bacterium 68-10]HMT63731.1 VC_2705 family sodium/solute symporter [Ottowia sp.]HMT83168.1 VC_2705 family sodium/solute symporter [Ottowia sp.]HQZ56614.1 VC_2705 family sodium/solute symporter [Ottowia sp.]HRB09718.1 VC_2705 family sodium/solute symporter [Ottowia sp.]